MQLDDYKKKVTALTDDLQRIQKISAELKMNDSAKRLGSITARLGEEVFKLVIVGEFSRGKSTFVNALLRRKILPAFKNPTTAVISKIVYGEKPDYKVYYKGQTAPQRLTEESFKKMIAAKEPDESDKDSLKEYAKIQEFFSSIDHAEISYPLEFCKDHVEVVDTPGTNDLNVGRMEITYGYLNHADAVILMLSATQPLSKSESEFLRERILGNQIHDIFFVISHKDDLSDAEGKQVEDFIRNNLKKILPPDVSLNNRIFLVSGLGALAYSLNERGDKLTRQQQLLLPETFEETGLPNFEFALGKFLSEEKGRARLRKYGRETLSTINIMQHDLSINIGIVSHSADEIRDKVAKFEETFKESKRRAKIIFSNMQSNFDVFIAGIDRRCRNASSRIIDKAQHAINNLTEDMSATAIQQAIESEVSVEKKKFIDDISAQWEEIFDAASKKAQSELAKIWKDIDITYQKEFSLAVVPYEDSTALQIFIPEKEKSTPSQFGELADKAFRDAFKGGIEWGERISHILTGVGNSVLQVLSGIWIDLFGSNAHEERRNKIRSQVIEAYQNQGKDMAINLKAQFQTQTRELCKSIQKDIDARIDDMERQLKEILAEKETQEQDTKSQCDYLAKMKDELKRIDNEVRQLTAK